MSDLIAALDDALALAGEWATLRRIVGSGANVINIDVRVRARIDVATAEQVAAGIKATDLNLIVSPTQINEAKWPGGQFAQVPPFHIDQRVPRINSSDSVIVRGLERTIAFCDPKFIGDELVRINLRVTG